MGDVLDRFVAHGFTIEILYDTDPENPREWDNLGTLAVWDSRSFGGYGDASARRFRYPLGWLRHVALEVTDLSSVMDAVEFEDLSEEQLIQQIEQRAEIIPVRLNPNYSGWIYATHETIAKEYKCDPEDLPESVIQDVKKVLEGEVETFRQFLDGEVYGYQVKNQEGEVLDSCWGFYGSPDYAMGEAREVAANLRSAEDQRRWAIGMVTGTSLEW